MMLRAMTAIGAVVLAMGTAVQAAPTPNPNLGSFRDWRTACDNVGDCMAIGFTADEYAVGPYAVVIRHGGPSAQAGVSIVLADDELEVADGAAVTVRVVGPHPVSFSGRASLAEELPRFDLEGSGAAGLIAAMKDGTTISVTFDGKPFGEVSLAGSSAALRWIDDRQGRAGGVTALVARGPKPASAVPAARPVPVVRAGPAVDQSNLPQGFPAALAGRADVAACKEEQADPEGDFAKPEAEARLSATEYLWSIPCGRGAYNFSSLYLIARADGSQARSPGLGDDDTLVNAGFDPESRSLSAFSKGRGFGDCGSADRWLWDGANFKRTDHSEMADCRAVAQGDWLVTYQAASR